MNWRRRPVVATAAAVVLAAVLSSGIAQLGAAPGGQRGGRGGPPAEPVNLPKARFASADPVRSSESLRSVVLPDTTIDAAVIAPGEGRTLPSCRVTATVTHPAPRDLLEALVAWVEQDRAPETLSAVRRDETGKVVRSRPLCQYPLVARDKGQGSTDEASSFECRAGF